MRRYLDEAIELGVDVDRGPAPTSIRPHGGGDRGRRGRSLPADRAPHRPAHGPDHRSRLVLPARLIRLVKQYGVERACGQPLREPGAADLDMQSRAADDLAAAGIAVFTMPLDEPVPVRMGRAGRPPRGSPRSTCCATAGVMICGGVGQRA